MGWLKDAKRDLLRRGSPAFRLGVWVAGAAGALLWIYMEEKKKPLKERVLFLPSKREVAMEKAEIDAWNQRLSGGKLLSFDGDEEKQQQLQQQGVEAARARQLAAIEQQAQQQGAAEKKEPQQGWFSSLLGLNDNRNTESSKQKKVPLLFDR